MEQARPGRKVQGTESLGGGGIVQGQERVLKTGGGRVQELEVAPIQKSDTSNALYTYSHMVEDMNNGYYS